MSLEPRENQQPPTGNPRIGTVNAAVSGKSNAADLRGASRFVAWRTNSRWCVATGSIEPAQEYVHAWHFLFGGAYEESHDDHSDAPAERRPPGDGRSFVPRSEEHTSELQSRQYLVCRLLLE